MGRRKTNLQLISNHICGELLGKDYSYTSTFFLVNYGLFYYKPYILPG